MAELQFDLRSLAPESILVAPSLKKSQLFHDIEALIMCHGSTETRAFSLACRVRRGIRE